MVDSLAEQLDLARATFTPGDSVVYITTDNYAVEGVVADPVAYIDHRCYLIRINMTNGDSPRMERVGKVKKRP